MLIQFLREILSDDPLQFPGTLDDVYSKVISELRQEFPDLDQYRYSLDDESAKSVACQLYKLFPSHCLKFLQALAIAELASLEEEGETDVLAWPSVTLVDIGCGAGAASAAFLALLQSYQQFLITNGKPISPIRALLIGFDPNANMLELYDQVVKEYARLLSPWLIDVRHDRLEEPFPQGVRRLTRQFQPANSHFVLLAISNVIRPLRNSFQKGQTPWWEKIRRALSGEPYSEPEFGAAEARAIRSILDYWKLNRVGLLSVATSGKDDSGTPWHKNLGRLTKAVRRLMSPHVSAGKGVIARTGRFENPRESWWRKCQGLVDFSTDYYFDYSVFTHESCVKDGQWQSVLAPRNIELAYVRARRYALREVLADEVEMRLFDYEVEEKLDRLRKQILSGDWKALNVEQVLLFDAPKKPGETRPKTVTRIEEQILGAAIIQCLGIHARPRQTASYSYILNNRSDEFLHEYYLSHWKRFIRDTHKSAKSRYVLRSDVKGFYQNIDQEDLVDIVKRVLGISEKTEQLLRALLLRDCGPLHNPGMGLPQGHVASGFWADLYLTQLDEVFSKLPGVTFARYADDMVFAIDDKVSDPDEVESQLQTALKELGLETSEIKTIPQAGDQYISETALDDLLDKLEARFNLLVSKAYRIDTKYQRLYKQDAWGFVSTYRRLLKLIPIHVSTPWLRRKLEQHSSWFRLPGSRLQFPPFPGSPDAEDDWLREFLTLNADWKDQLERLRHDLADLCRVSLDMLSTPTSTEVERIKARRRLGFAAKRLCDLGLGELADLLAAEIVQRPCRVPVHLLCRGLADCGHGDLLIQIFETSDSAFVRAWAIRALAEVYPTPPAEGIERMWATLFRDSSTACEKLKASEALLFADRWETADIASCQRLIEQETDPYILKNYVLIISRAFGDAVRGYLRRLQENCSALVVVDAVQYALRSPSRSLAHQDEPDALLRYYSKNYPPAESDIEEEPSPFRWAF
jgi:hypothetical protein